MCSPLGFAALRDRRRRLSPHGSILRNAFPGLPGVAGAGGIGGVAEALRISMLSCSLFNTM